MFYHLPAFLHQEQQRRLKNLFMVERFLSSHTTLHIKLWLPQKACCCFPSCGLLNPKRVGNKGWRTQNYYLEDSKELQGDAAAWSSFQNADNKNWGLGLPESPDRHPSCQSHGNGHVSVGNLIWATHRNRSSPVMPAVCLSTATRDVRHPLLPHSNSSLGIPRIKNYVITILWCRQRCGMPWLIQSHL